MGTYTKVLEGKPKLGAEPEQREQVEAWKKELLATPGFVLTPSVITEWYMDARDEADELKEKLADVNARTEALRQFLVERAEVEGLSSLRLTNGRGIVIVSEPYPNVVDKEAFRQWCLAQGFESQMTLHPSTAKAVVKERLLHGEPEPPGVEIYSKDVIRLDRKR
jgi:hypothetical protein